MRSQRDTEGVRNAFLFAKVIERKNAYFAWAIALNASRVMSSFFLYKGIGRKSGGVSPSWRWGISSSRPPFLRINAAGRTTRARWG